MTPEKMIKTIEHDSDLIVLNIFDCEDKYVASCMNSKTGSVIGDFYYIAQKNEDTTEPINPAADPIGFASMMKNKKSVYQNTRAINQLLRIK